MAWSRDYRWHVCWNNDNLLLTCFIRRYMNMKKTLTLFALIFICTISFGQNKWFSLYADSTTLVKDADEIIRQFIADLRKTVQLDIKVEKQTTPYLIYNDKNIIYLF